MPQARAPLEPQFSKRNTTFPVAASGHAHTAYVNSRGCATECLPPWPCLRPAVTRSGSASSGTRVFTCSGSPASAPTAGASRWLPYVRARTLRLRPRSPGLLLLASARREARLAPRRRAPEAHLVEHSASKRDLVGSYRTRSTFFHIFAQGRRGHQPLRHPQPRRKAAAQRTRTHAARTCGQRI
jgi:hypothetical protein